MKFNPNDYGRNAVMHCSTEEQAIVFCNHLHSLGRRWKSGQAYSTRTLFTEVEGDIYYYFHQDVCSTYRPLFDYTVLEFSDFEWDNYTQEPKTEPIKLRFTW